MSHATFDALEPGDALPDLVAGEITAAGLRAFAEASGDDNPIHLDEAAARANGLPGIIAHGMLNMAYMGRFVTAWAPQRAIRRLETRFAAMAFIGDIITCTGTVAGKREENGEKLVDIAIEVRNQKGETLLAGSATVALA